MTEGPILSRDYFQVPNKEECDRTGRQRVAHNPLLSDKPTYLPKPSWLINLGSGAEHLTLAARRLENLLLALSWNSLSDPEPDYRFAAHCSEVRRAMGQRAAHDNIGLRAAAQVLAETPIELPSFPAGLGNPSAPVPLLSGCWISGSAEEIHWSYSEPMRLALSAPSAPSGWGWVNLSEAQALTSKYALALYERASLLARRQYPQQTHTVDELRQVLAVGGKYRDWHALATRALNPAIQEVNARTELTVSTKLTKSLRRRHAISKVQIIVSTNKVES